MKISTTRCWLSCAGMILVLMTVILSTEGALAHTINPNPGVFPRKSHPFGLSYTQWSAKWWQRAFSLTAAEFNDTKDCSHRQSGPVWFLNGTGGGAATRECTVPRGKAIMFPVINAEQSILEPPCGVGTPGNIPVFPHGTNNKALRNCAIAVTNHTTEVEADIDGKKLQGLMKGKYLAISPPFCFKAIPGNIFGFTGKGRSVSDGVWIILKPLHPGTHILHF
ncbi:MAG TPA: hypothetical protein VGN34_28130, partial [Ktedonobacteraceae bacterium]